MHRFILLSSSFLQAGFQCLNWPKLQNLQMSSTLELRIFADLHRSSQARNFLHGPSPAKRRWNEASERCRPSNMDKLWHSGSCYSVNESKLDLALNSDWIGLGPAPAMSKHSKAPQAHSKVGFQRRSNFSTVASAMDMVGGSSVWSGALCKLWTCLTFDFQSWLIAEVSFCTWILQRDKWIWYHMAM